MRRRLGYLALAASVATIGLLAIPGIGLYVPFITAALGICGVALMVSR